MKKISCLFLALIMLLFFVACGATKDNVVGTWTSSWIYNGEKVVKIVSIDSDGTFKEIVYRDGRYSAEHGTWTISRGTLETKATGSFSATPYKYSDSKLKNGDHIYVKK